MWIIEYPISDEPHSEQRGHLLEESKRYIIGRSPRSDFHTEKKKISKVQFVVSFKNHDLVVDNKGKGKFDVNGDYLPNGKCYGFSKRDKEVKDLHFSFQSEPLEFRIRYKRFVLNDRATVEELNSKGVNAEFSLDADQVSHYLIGSDDTMDTIMGIFRRNRHLKLMTREFVESILIHVADLKDDFERNWPEQRDMIVFVVDDNDYERMKDIFAEESSVKIRRVKDPGELASNTAVWKGTGRGFGTFEGLNVSEMTLIYDILRKEAEPPRKQTRRTIRRPIRRPNAISGLQTMMNFDIGDDFKVIKLEDSAKSLDTTLQVVGDSQSEVEEDEIRTNEEDIPTPRKTQFMKVDMTDIEKVQDKSELTTDSRSSELIKLEAETSDSLVKAFQGVKKAKQIDAQQEKSLIESMDKAGTPGVKVVKFKVSEDEIQRGYKVYQPASYGVFSNPEWTNRKEYSRFKKTAFPDGNPITDSTVKGIKMKMAEYKSNCIYGEDGKMSKAEKELLDFNSGLEDLDNEFEVANKKRSGDVLGSRKKFKTNTALFVDSDSIEDDFEPSFRRKLQVVEEDDVPTFRKRRR
ncbi:hypothetical protein FOA43_001989 [Brettanomyces nanus]|uniref:FHA domain-containing protein n=1 Tax=Eeniella nana TaxID=13502 RepID=A0A875RUJ9_EENNA|nr:uncharacterized protein FOA43_001989 [Brettanomyces nanus]QPG74657.1 hypothetical protein FOA43_001989 [Brettanomyces nanus]